MVFSALGIAQLPDKASLPFKIAARGVKVSVMPVMDKEQMVDALLI